MPEGGQGGGAGTGTQTGTDGEHGERLREPRITRRKKKYDRPSDLVESYIRKFSSRDRAIEELDRQLFELREERRERDEETEALKPRIAPEGAVILIGDDKKKWDAVKDLKLDGAKIAERVQMADKLEGEKQKSELSAKRKAVAQADGVNGDVLDPLLDQFGLEVETKEIQVQGTDGKLTPKQVAHVRKAGDANAAWEKLTDVIARDGSPLKPFTAALAVKQSTGGTTTTQGSTSLNFPDQQGGSGGGGGSSVADEVLKRNKERAERPNPLRATTENKGAA